MTCARRLSGYTRQMHLYPCDAASLLQSIFTFVQIFLTKALVPMYPTAPGKQQSSVSFFKVAQQLQALCWLIHHRRREMITGEGIQYTQRKMYSTSCGWGSVLEKTLGGLWEFSLCRPLTCTKSYITVQKGKSPKTSQGPFNQALVGCIVTFLLPTIKPT